MPNTYIRKTGISTRIYEYVEVTTYERIQERKRSYISNILKIKKQIKDDLSDVFEDSVNFRILMCYKIEELEEIQIKLLEKFINECHASIENNMEVYNELRAAM
jgi:hypothetical protein